MASEAITRNYGDRPQWVNVVPPDSDIPHICEMFGSENLVAASIRGSLINVALDNAATELDHIMRKRFGR